MQISHKHFQNQYGESINHPDTWDFIANELMMHGSMVIGWSDERFTRFTLLFSLPRPLFSRRAELFVTISGYGTVAIPRDFREPITAETVEEYFGVGENSQAAGKLAELLEEVLKRLG